MAALDLGGGSTQITFVPNGMWNFTITDKSDPSFKHSVDKGTIDNAPAGFVHQVGALHNNLDVYSFR